MRVRLLLLLLGLCAAAGPAGAQGPRDFAWLQHPGAVLPAEAVLRDEMGRDIRLGDLLSTMPAVLDLGYFHCPSLCGVVRSGLYVAAQAGGLVPGRDFALLSLSIDPAETPADAAHAKAADLAQNPGVASGIHYLTGDARAVAATVGFRSRYDPAFKQFMHPAGLVLLTRGGTVSAYLLGAGPTGGELRAAVFRAGDGGIAEAALPILLLCFHFDSTTGRYTLEVQKLLRLGAVLTVLSLTCFLTILHRRGRDATGIPSSGDHPGTAPGGQRR